MRWRDEWLTSPLQVAWSAPQLHAGRKCYLLSSQISRHTSHVTRHTSHVTRHQMGHCQRGRRVPVDVSHACCPGSANGFPGSLKTPLLPPPLMTTMSIGTAWRGGSWRRARRPPDGRRLQDWNSVLFVTHPAPHGRRGGALYRRQSAWRLLR